MTGSRPVQSVIRRGLDLTSSCVFIIPWNIHCYCPKLLLFSCDGLPTVCDNGCYCLLTEATPATLISTCPSQPVAATSTVIVFISTCDVGLCWRVVQPMFSANDCYFTRITMSMTITVIVSFGPGQRAEVAAAPMNRTLADFAQFPG